MATTKKPGTTKKRASTKKRENLVISPGGLYLTIDKKTLDALKKVIKSGKAIDIMFDELMILDLPETEAIPITNVQLRSTPPVAPARPRKPTKKKTSPKKKTKIKKR